MRASTVLTSIILLGGLAGAIWAQDLLPGFSVSSGREANAQNPASPVKVAAMVAPADEGRIVSDAAPPSPALSEPSASAPPQRLVQAPATAAPAAADPAPAAPSSSAEVSPPPAMPEPPAPKAELPTCTHPGALGVSRVVEVDTKGGPGFGFEHFKMHDFLREKEVVFTFDDGPWPNNTPAVLEALDAECVKAVFFPIGKHATYHPEILKQVEAAGHTIGSHTWSHANLNRVKGDEARKEEIEKGLSAVAWALKHPPSPFFRFPALQHPPDMVTYLGERNVGIFSTDLDSFDFKMRKPEQVVKSVMSKLDKRGKGIILMHDFQGVTAKALPELLAQLKAGGYKVVHMKAAAPATTIAKYDEELIKSAKLPTVSSRPTSSVIKTIAE